jgi:hypothetical protein
MNSHEAFDELWSSLIGVEEYLRSGMPEQLQNAESFSDEDMRPVHNAFQTFRRVYPHLNPEIRDDAEDLFGQLESGLNDFLDSLRQFVAVPEADIQSRKSAKSNVNQVLNRVLQQHRQALNDLARQRSSIITINGSKEKKDYDVFISHASEDKDELVRPLANVLQKEGCTVWYDEFELKLGDSLRRSIDRGLADSRFGVVVLSKHYFSKEWPKAELDGLVSKQREMDRTVILPIWHGVSKKEVLDHSPTLADTYALISSEWSKIDEIAVQILRVIK